MKPIIRMVVRGKLRLRLVQPESADAEIRIIFPAFLPYVLSCTRIGRVHKHIVAMEDHLHIDTGIALHKKSLLFHLLIILAAPVHLRPDRHHHLDTHILYLTDHFFRMREILLVKTPVAASGPMVIINDKHIHGNVSLLILTRDLQYLFFIVVSELALPEAKPVLRHHGHPSRHRRIRL